MSGGNPEAVGVCPVIQADRDAAGELWVDLGNDIPEAQDGHCATLLETMAIAFAAHRTAANAKLVEALADITDLLVATVSEFGCWEAEDHPKVIAARAALAGEDRA